MGELLVVFLFALTWAWPVIGLIAGALIGRSRVRTARGTLAGAGAGFLLGLAGTALWMFVVVPAINQSAGPM